MPIIRGTTQEILLEVWNEGGQDTEPTFLGMCLFPVDELILSTPTQTRIVALQRHLNDADFDGVSNGVDASEESTTQTSLTIMVSHFNS